MFEPNLICWSSEEDEDIHHATTINEFLDACEAMTEEEDDERPRKVITFFHNRELKMETFSGRRRPDW